MQKNLNFFLLATCRLYRSTNLITLYVGVILLTACSSGSNNTTVGTTQDCAGVVPTVAESTGQLLIQLPQDIKMCAASGYIVGFKELLKGVPLTNGSFFIDNVPMGNYDIIITAESLTMNLDDQNRGQRLKQVKFLNSILNDYGLIELPEMGQLSGVVKQLNSSDHTGIDVYIPGTEYIAKTSLDGAYSFSAVPVGEHNIYFEKDGYHRGQIEAIKVTSNTTTILPDTLLVVSTGADGFLMINAGSSTAQSKIVNLTIGATIDAVLMKISEEISFAGSSWQAMRSSTSYTFESAGEKTLYIKFANSNGLESSPFSSHIIIDDSKPNFEVLQAEYLGRSLVNLTITMNQTKLATVRRMRIGPAATLESSEWVDFNSTVSVPFASTLRIELEDIYNRRSAVNKTIVKQARLSSAKRNMGSATAGGKIFFAGGYSASGLSDVVEIFDTATKLWSTASLSVARLRVATTVVGNQVLFAGGWEDTSGPSNAVDIFDVATGQLSSSALSIARDN
nr:hypothetical protein [Oligoflexales bacterium]